MVTNDLLLERIESLAGTIRESSERMDNLYHLIFEGNGKPSLMVQAATLDQRVGFLEARARDGRVPRAVWLPLVLSVLLGLASLLASVLHR